MGQRAGHTYPNVYSAWSQKKYAALLHVLGFSQQFCESIGKDSASKLVVNACMRTETSSHCKRKESELFPTIRSRVKKVGVLEHWGGARAVER